MIVITIFYSMIAFITIYCICTKNYAGVLTSFFMSIMILLAQDVNGFEALNRPLKQAEFLKNYIVTMLLPLVMLILFFISIVIENVIKKGSNKKQKNIAEKRKHLISEREREYLTKTTKESEIERYFTNGIDCQDELLLIDKVKEKEEWLGEVQWIDSCDKNDIFESTYLIINSNLLCTVLFYNKKVLIQYHIQN